MNNAGFGVRPLFVMYVKFAHKMKQLHTKNEVLFPFVFKTRMTFLLDC